MLLILVLAPFAGSLVAICIPAHKGTASAWLSGSIALFCLATSAGLYPIVAADKVLRYDINWLPELGLNFSLRMDGFAWMFASLVTAIGLLVVIYARYYMSASDPVPRFFALFLAFMGAMLGMVLSGNLILLAIFWELTSIISFLLIGYWHHNANARDGARMALTVTGTGGLCMFVGLMLIGHIVGSYDLDVVLSSGDLIRNDPLYTTVLILILLGALTKERAVSVPFLAAPCHGGTDAGIRLPAFRHSGQSRCVSADPALARHGGHRPVVLVRRSGRAQHPLLGAYFAIFPAGPEGAACLFDDQPSRPHHRSAQPWQPAGCGCGDFPHHEPRHLQGLAVHGGRDHRP